MHTCGCEERSRTAEPEELNQRPTRFQTEEGVDGRAGPAETEPRAGSGLRHMPRGAEPLREPPAPRTAPSGRLSRRRSDTRLAAADPRLLHRGYVVSDQSQVVVAAVAQAGW